MTTIHKTVTIPSDRRLHLEVDLPSEMPPGEAEVTLHIQARKPSQMKQVVERLRRMAERGGITSIPDASKWQRDTRSDRPLPFRD